MSSSSRYDITTLVELINIIYVTKYREISCRVIESYL